MVIYLIIITNFFVLYNENEVKLSVSEKYFLSFPSLSPISDVPQRPSTQITLPPYGTTAPGPAVNRVPGKPIVPFLSSLPLFCANKQRSEKFSAILREILLIFLLFDIDLSKKRKYNIKRV